MTGIKFNEKDLLDIVEGKRTQIFGKYKVGETLYVNEPFFVLPDDGGTIVYKYGNPEAKEWESTEDFSWNYEMPEKFARYFIRITRRRAKECKWIYDFELIKYEES